MDTIDINNINNNININVNNNADYTSINNNQRYLSPKINLVKKNNNDKNINNLFPILNNTRNISNRKETKIKLKTVDVVIDKNCLKKSSNNQKIKDLKNNIFTESNK